MQLIDHALAYAARGWPVFPCSLTKQPIISHREGGRGFHDATKDIDLVNAWWGQWPNASIGIPTGRASGLIVLDIDPDKGGWIALHDIMKQHGELPDTVTSLTGGGGIHYLFKYPGVPIPNSTSKIGDGIDVRGDGGYFIAPPSPHESGCNYEWEISSEPEDIPIADIPDWLMALLFEERRQDRVRPDEDIPEKQRNSTLFRLASQMRRSGWDESAIYSALSTQNANRCKPPLDDKEVRRIAQSASRYVPEHQKIPETEPETENESKLPTTSYGDVFNAELLILRHGDTLRFCEEWNAWYIWKGTHWVKDRESEVYDYARNALKWALDIAFKNENGLLMKHIVKSRSHRGLTNMLAQAGTMIIRRLPEQFDQHEFLFNCRNGTIDLRDGSLLPHDPALLITKCAYADYEPDTGCEHWQRFLRQIMGACMQPDISPEDTAADIERKEQEANQAPIDMIGFLQRAVGYSLYGSNEEKVLLIPWGSGDNGKTTFIETLAEILGDGYARRTATSVFLAKRDGGIPNDVAALVGVRFAYAAEPAQDRRLDEALIKELTGGDKVAARFMRGEFFEFRPVCTVWMCTNHKPPTRDTGNGLWNRIKLIPFTVNIPKKDQDRQLRKKLLKEKNGILAWAVKGCLDWQEGGLQEPSAVTDATAEYREENDTVSLFIEECCALHPSIATRSSVLYESYKLFCDRSGERELSNKAFSKALEEKGFNKRRSNGISFEGIGILAENEPEGARY